MKTTRNACSVVERIYFTLRQAVGELNAKEFANQIY